MIIRALVFLLMMIMLGASCVQQPIDKEKGKEIADNKLAELASSNYFSRYHIDVSSLPQPTIEFQGNELLVDYKDINQNAWIVIIIHPDGSAELSYTKIRK